MGNYLSSQNVDIYQKSTFENSKQCHKCKGIGLMKTEFITCYNCDGKKCYKCNELGYTQSSWSECNICYGTGTIGEITRPNSIYLNTYK